MDYEKKQRLIALRDSMKSYGYIDGVEELDSIFPELKESEDERNKKIKKEVIEMLHYYHSKSPCFIPPQFSLEETLAWLEKQGEKFQYWKPSKEQLGALDYAYNSCPDTERGNYYEGVLETLIDDLHKLSEKQGEQKPTEMAEPKFQNGQWIVWQDKCYKVNYNGCGYELVDQNGLNTSLEYEIIDENARLWDITKDAKDGDVLATKKGNPFIYDKNRYNNGLAYYYAGLDVNKELTLKSPHHMLAHFGELSNVFPATKEQRDLLFQKMKEAGYEWDAEKKELKKIEQNVAWSEEDERILNKIQDHLREFYVDKKGYPYIADKKFTRDERIRAKLLSYFNGFEESTSFGSREVIEIRHWLKSIRPVKQDWSEEDEKNPDREIHGKCQEGMYDIETK